MKDLVVLFALTVVLTGCLTGPDSSSGAVDGGPTDGAGVPYLQQGADAARTGATADPGPETFDLAFRLDLPGIRWREVVPVILDGAVYVVTSQEGRGIWRIDLETGRESLVADFSSLEGFWISTFFSDGQRLFVGLGNEVAAFTPDGERVWTYEFPQSTPTPAHASNCMPGAYEQGMIFLGCRQVGSSAQANSLVDDVPIEAPSDTAMVAVALQAETGEEIWHTVRSVLDPVEQGARAHIGVGSLMRTALGPAHFFVEGMRGRPSMDPLELTLDEQPEVESRHFIWAFDRMDGSFAWSWGVPMHTASGALLEGTEERLERDSLEYVDMGLVATEQALFVKADRLHALDPNSGEELWDLPLRQAGDSDQQGYALAFFDGDLFVTSHSHLYRVEVSGQNIKWSVRTAPGDNWDDTIGLLVANGALYGVTNQGRLSIYDIADGSLLHQHRIGPQQSATDAYAVAVGEGVAVAIRRDGETLVFGRPPAGIQPSFTVSSYYPAPAQSVRLDLSGTTPGALADDLAYQVNWGDGTLSAWQSRSDFSHTYPRAGDHTATIRVRNSADQEASETVVFHVGTQPPWTPSLLEAAFEPENHDLTFGVLGIIVALGGGIIALGWRQTKRSRLQRELNAIERAFEAKNEDSPECEAALLERKAHCRRLLLHGRLDESQFAVLENRIHELTRTLRVTALDERFDFLPYGLVKSLKEMLSDGRVSAWERTHVIRALDEDPVLTKRQKSTVRKQVDQWFQRDEGVQG